LTKWWVRTDVLLSSVVVKDLRLKDEDKDKDLMSKDEDLKIGP